MANSIFRLTLIFLVIFAVVDADGRRYGNEQGTVDSNDSRRSQEDRQQIVDKGGVKGRRNQDEDRHDDDELQRRRMHVRNTRNESQRPTTRDKRHVRERKSRSQSTDRNERSSPGRNTNYDRRDQDEDRINTQDMRMFIHANKHKQRRLPNQDRRDRDDQNRNGYRNQERSDRNERREQVDRRNRNWDAKVHDRKDRRDEKRDRRYRVDWDRVDRYDLDRRGYSDDRRDLEDWVFKERLDQNQYYDRRNKDDDRSDENWDYRNIRHHDLRDDDDDDQYSDRRDRADDRRNQDRDDDDDDDDDDDYNRRDQDYERYKRQQRQRNNRNYQNQYTRNSDRDLENEETRRYIDYRERLRIQGNQNNHWLQYTFQGDDFPKKNYNLQVHRFDIIQPDLKHQEVDPRVLAWQDKPWNRNKIRPIEDTREYEMEKKDHFLEALKLLDKSTAIVLKTVHNDSSDSNQSLEILNVLDNLADQGICNPSEAHYDWIYSTAVPIAIAEVKMQPGRVAEKIKRKVDISHLAIAELRQLIETVASTLCPGELPDNCNAIIRNAINDSPSRDVLDRQLVYLKHISTLGRIFADYLPEYAEAAKSNTVMAYFHQSKGRTWPLVNKIIIARIDAGAALKKCQY